MLSILLSPEVHPFWVAGTDVYGDMYPSGRGYKGDGSPHTRFRGVLRGTLAPYTPYVYLCPVFGPRSGGLVYALAYA